eukprot:6202449-Pyramimonas_sp.AAC.1
MGDDQEELAALLRSIPPDRDRYKFRGVLLAQRMRDCKEVRRARRQSVAAHVLNAIKRMNEQYAVRQADVIDLSERRLFRRVVQSCPIQEPVGWGRRSGLVWSGRPRKLLDED